MFKAFRLYITFIIAFSLLGLAVQNTISGKEHYIFHTLKGDIEVGYHCYLGNMVEYKDLKDNIHYISATDIKTITVINSSFLFSGTRVKNVSYHVK